MTLSYRKVRAAGSREVLQWLLICHKMNAPEYHPAAALQKTAVIIIIYDQLRYIKSAAGKQSFYQRPGSSADQDDPAEQ